MCYNICMETKQRTNLSLNKESLKELEKLSIKLFGSVNLSMTVEFLINQAKNKKIELKGTK